RIMAPDACRPFSAGRRGMVLGEGAGIFVLEPLDRAQARGAPILAELAGTGMSSDASDITLPNVEGPTSAMRLALADAGLAPDAPRARTIDAALSNSFAFGGLNAVVAVKRFAG